MITIKIIKWLISGYENYQGRRGQRRRKAWTWRGRWRAWTEPWDRRARRSGPESIPERKRSARSRRPRSPSLASLQSSPLMLWFFFFLFFASVLVLSLCVNEIAACKSFFWFNASVCCVVGIDSVTSLRCCYSDKRWVGRRRLVREYSLIPNHSRCL